MTVGEKGAGSPSAWNPYGYGGGGRGYSYPTGGGLTGVFTGTTDITDWTSTSEQSRMIICAGGGGARGHQGSSSAGSGGGSSGTAGKNSANSPGGLGGSQSAAGGVSAGGGASGSGMRGGESNGSPEEAAGAGGYFGGGGGGSTYGSGGGSGYVGTQNSLTSGLTYVGASSEKTSDPDYPGSDVAKVLFKYNTSLYKDMTLQSNAFTAQADPTTARIIIDEEDVNGATTLNTDLKAYASRDGGTTFTQMTLADQGFLLPNPGNDIYTKLMLHM